MGIFSWFVDWEVEPYQSILTFYPSKLLPNRNNTSSIATTTTLNDTMLPQMVRTKSNNNNNITQSLPSSPAKGNVNESRKQSIIDDFFQRKLDTFLKSIPIAMKSRQMDSQTTVSPTLNPTIKPTNRPTEAPTQQKEAKTSKDTEYLTTSRSNAVIDSEGMKNMDENDNESILQVSNKTIWIFWKCPRKRGTLFAMSDFMRLCISSMRYHNPDWNIIVVNPETNIDRYLRFDNIELPYKHIFDSLTDKHQSDDILSTWIEKRQECFLK